jgi:hypothetical protein
VVVEPVIRGLSHRRNAAALEIAQQALAEHSNARLASARVGDARQLDEPDGSADAVLLMGPLYHLTEREDRL